MTEQEHSGRGDSPEERLAGRFEAERPRLRAVAYRLLGSLSDADDAVQEAWLRLARSQAEDIENLSAWLTTVVARISLNLLRSRTTRREEPLEVLAPEEALRADADGPAEEAELAELVGLALLVVLDTLSPAERLAFVLHDMFDLPFEEVARIGGRTPGSARQLASRARRRVRGAEPPSGQELGRQRHLVEAYLSAARAGDLEALVRLLAPEVELRADPQASPSGRPVRIAGARAVAGGAVASAVRARRTDMALVNGRVGLVMAPRGRLSVVMSFAFEGDRVVAIDVIADPDRLRALEISVLD